jgi:hypothetical protein
MFSRCPHRCRHQPRVAVVILEQPLYNFADLIRLFLATPFRARHTALFSGHRKNDFVH